MGDMPVPGFAYRDRNDGRVFIFKVGSDGRRHKKTIGHMTVSEPGKERMIPNQYFRATYQNEYLEAYPGKSIPFHEISIGMYALTHGVINKTGLYAVLKEVYGPVYANSLLDYAMFSILHRSGVTQLYERTMRKEVLFDDRLRSDNWYSKFFAKKINEDLHHQFRIKWVNALQAEGLTKVWLAIDGSNNDCEARRSFLTQYGFPKSHNANKTVVGYMYAVDAATGRPVTYFVYEGSVPDSQAFQKMATFLGAFNIDIEGVILDRGFAVDSVFKTIHDKSWKYVVMLPGDTLAHTRMVEEHGDKIRWKSEHVLENEAFFGISDRQRLFASHERESEICLLFDGCGGSLKSMRLIKKIQTAKRKAMQAISSGKRAAIEKGLQKYISIETDGETRKITMHYDNWDKAMSTNGFHSLAVADGINPSRALDLYKMRDTSETQYAILKSQEGCAATRVHSTEGIYGKFAVAFMASLIRHEIEKACKKNDQDTNPMIQSMEHVCLLYTPEEKYEAVRNLSTEVRALLSEFGLDQDDIERMARAYNDRQRTDCKKPVREFPNKNDLVIQQNSHKRGRPSKNTEQSESNSQTTAHGSATVEKSKGGRPKGKKDSKPRKPRSDKGKPRVRRGHSN